MQMSKSVYKFIIQSVEGNLYVCMQGEYIYMFYIGINWGYRGNRFLNIYYFIYYMYVSRSYGF